MVIETFWCATCGGIKPGWKVPDDHAVIMEFAAVIGLVDEAGRPTKVGEALTLDFYGALFTAAPYLKPRFADDLLDANSALDGRAAKQRDSLLKAILAALTLFNPGDEKRMGALKTMLESAAQKHTRHGAQFEEYGAVIKLLLGCLAGYAKLNNVPQAVWEGAYQPALRRALSFASGWMVAHEALVGATPSVSAAETAVLDAPESGQLEQAQQQY